MARFVSERPRLASHSAQPALSGTRLRVVHITSGDLWAGAEVQLYQLAMELVRQNVDISIVLLNEGLLSHRLREAGIPTHVFDEGRLGPARILFRILRYLRRVRPDIVHTHGLKENVLGAVAALALPETPTLRTVHGSSEVAPTLLSRSQRMVRSIDTWIGRRMQSRVVAVSEDLGVRLRSVFGSEQVTVIPNGFAAATPIPDSAPLPGSGRYRIAVVGRLVPVKRVDVFLEICRTLLNSDPGSIEGYVMGDGPLRSELEGRARDLGIASHVHFLGFMPNVSALLMGMDALLMPSDHEGLPMTVLEAMSLRVPVIGHAAGGLPEVLEHGRCGVLLNNQDANAWAGAFRKLMAAPDRDSMVDRALLRLHYRYSAARCATGYLALYDELLRSGVRRGAARDGR